MGVGVADGLFNARVGVAVGVGVTVTQEGKKAELQTPPGTKFGLDGEQNGPLGEQNNPPPQHPTGVGVLVEV